MGNDNYHESMEKNRQELSQERMAELTRRARQMPKPKSRGLLLPSLFFIFILIPVTLLIYVAFYYEPDDTLTAKTNENEVSFELNSQPPSDSTVLAAADDQEKDEEEKDQDYRLQRAKLWVILTPVLWPVGALGFGIVFSLFYLVHSCIQAC